MHQSSTSGHGWVHRDFTLGSTTSWCSRINSCKIKINRFLTIFFLCCLPKQKKKTKKVREMLLHKFGKDACKHLIESSVNSKVQFKLSIETPDQTVVYEYLSDIAKNAGLTLNIEPPVRAQAPIKVIYCDSQQ